MDLHPKEQLIHFLGSRTTARDLIFKGAELRGIRLAGLRADGLDLEDADLRESALSEVRWKGCILRDARLDAADFTAAVLRLCDFDQARLTNAILVQARLENSTARGARFDGADLTGAVLTDTDFSRATLRGAKLKGVSASGADFRGADLRGALLQNAELVDADLRGADLTEADLRDADLHGADLRGVLGDDPALQQADSQWGELPAEMKALSETMTPIVLEVLQTAGRRGVMDAGAAERLIDDVTRHQSPSPGKGPAAETMKAVSRVLDELGDDVLPALLGALRQPNQADPPPEVRAMIARLRDAFSLDETASVDDVLSRLLNGMGHSSR